MRNIIIEKIKTLCVSYEIIHGRVVENSKRSQKQTIQIFITMAAFFAFAATIQADDYREEMQLIGRYIFIYLIPLLSFSAIIGILSIEIRQIYLGIYLTGIENKVNGYFEELTSIEEPVLCYERYRITKGHRKDQSSNLDFYILGIATIIIGIGPSILFLYKNSSNIEILVFIIEMVSIGIFLIITILRFSKVNLELRKMNLKQ